jgi:uncharacterized membrane protein YeaQ/YmgE (transglycosylase-associated protein family)
MDFMTRLQNSWDLFTKSLTVMMTYKKLLFFPFITAVLTTLIVIFFIAPVALQPTGYAYTSPQHWKAISQTIFTDTSTDARSSHDKRHSVELTNNGALFVAFIYWVAMFFATFFTVAFYSEILYALNGHDVEISRGLLFAGTKIPSILIWSLFAGLIGYLIRTLEEKVGLFGKIIFGIIGIAWSVASIFVIPFIITETSINPFHLLRQSADALKKTWGESLIGYVGIQLGGIVVFISSLVMLGGAGFIAIKLQSASFMIMAIALWFTGIIAFSYLAAVSNHIYRCALYLFAVEGKVPAPFDRAAMQSAWKMKE